MRWSRCAVAFAAVCAGSMSAQCQSVSKKTGILGTYHLVRIDAPGPDGKHTDAPQPTGMLIYTADGHGAVQLMYPRASLSNEFVHDGYEATYDTIQVDAAKHRILYHVEASATRNKLVGQTETLSYEVLDAYHMVIRPADPTQHWSVTWGRFVPGYVPGSSACKVLRGDNPISSIIVAVVPIIGVCRSRKVQICLESAKMVLARYFTGDGERT